MFKLKPLVKPVLPLAQASARQLWAWVPGTNWALFCLSDRFALVKLDKKYLGDLIEHSREWKWVEIHCFKKATLCNPRVYTDWKNGILYLEYTDGSTFARWRFWARDVPSIGATETFAELALCASLMKSKGGISFFYKNQPLLENESYLFKEDEFYADTKHSNSQAIFMLTFGLHKCLETSASLRGGSYKLAWLTHFMCAWQWIFPKISPRVESNLFSKISSLDQILFYWHRASYEHFVPVFSSQTEDECYAYECIAALGQFFLSSFVSIVEENTIYIPKTGMQWTKQGTLYSLKLPMGDLSLQWRGGQVRIIQFKPSKTLSLKFLYGGNKRFTRLQTLHSKGRVKQIYSFGQAKEFKAGSTYIFDNIRY